MLSMSLWLAFILYTRVMAPPSPHRQGSALPGGHKDQWWRLGLIMPNLDLEEVNTNSD